MPWFPRRPGADQKHRVSCIIAKILFPVFICFIATGKLFYFPTLKLSLKKKAIQLSDIVYYGCIEHSRYKLGLFFESSKNMVSGKVISWKMNQNEHLGSQKSQRTLHTRQATSDEGIKKKRCGANNISFSLYSSIFRYFINRIKCQIKGQATEGNYNGNSIKKQMGKHFLNRLINIA